MVDEGAGLLYHEGPPESDSRVISPTHERWIASRCPRDLSLQTKPRLLHLLSAVFVDETLKISMVAYLPQHLSRDSNSPHIATSPLLCYTLAFPQNPSHLFIQNAQPFISSPTPKHPLLNPIDPFTHSDVCRTIPPSSPVCFPYDFNQPLAPIPQT